MTGDAATIWRSPIPFSGLSARSAGVPGALDAELNPESGLVAIPDELDSIDAAPLLCAGLTTPTTKTRSRSA